MGFRAILITVPHEHWMKTCEQCGDDVEQLHSPNTIVPNDTVYTLVIETRLGSEHDEEIKVCSLDCLTEWIHQRQKKNPGER